MKQRNKRTISLLLAMVLTGSCFNGITTNVTANVLEDEKASVPAIGLEGKGKMSLTDMGSEDWVHVTAEQINRKQKEEVPGEDMGVVTVKIDNINPDETGYIKFGAYYQKFTASADGTVSRVALRLFKRSDVAQDLTAKFWEVGESNKLLSQVRLEGEKIEDYAVTEVPFEDEIEVKAGKVYAVSLEKDLGVSGDIYGWLLGKGAIDGGFGEVKIKEGGIWKENTGGGESKTKKCSLCVEITSTDSSVNLIDFDTFGSADVTGSKETDVTYDWTDGNPMVSGKGIKTAGIVTSADDGDAGWRIKIPQSDVGQTVTFASGAFQAAAAVEVYLNDQTTPAYTYDDLNAADQVAQKIYTVYIEPDSSAEIRTVFKSKAAADGYLLIGGITLDKMEESVDYINLLQNAVRTAKAWLGETISESISSQFTATFASAQEALERDDLTNADAYREYMLLNAAIAAAEANHTMGKFANSDAKGLKVPFGREGDKYAPVAWVDGTCQLPDNGNKVITFGVPGLQADTVQWYNAEGYLPCLVNEYSKDGMNYKVENFTDSVMIDDKRYEVVYSRMTVVNNSENIRLLPIVSSDLIPLNDAAEYIKAVQPGETIVREYCVGADRFGGGYEYPVDAVLAAQGSFEEHYTSMKEYWDAHLENTNYVVLLQEAVKTARACMDGVKDEYLINQLTARLDQAQGVLENKDLVSRDAYSSYLFLSAAIDTVKPGQTSGNFANNYAKGFTASFGWEGDKDAPIAWADGTYKLRANDDKTITFGVTGLPAKSINWYNAEGYLPCFVSEYSKDGMDYKIENFADMLVIDEKEYEVAYSRMTVVNNSEEIKLLPTVSSYLIPLNDAAKNVKAIEPGETVVREYCIGADRFGGVYTYPADAVLAAQGSFDEHYAHMKEYWNNRLEKIVDIQSIPEKYEELINAYKAGYIYTLIIADGYELHVGENGYDRVFDHDVIGMLATLVESGHTEHFADYAQYILQNIQYPDAAWKFSWPFALYLQKTGDFDTVLSFMEDKDGVDGIRTNTHKIASEREVYSADILDEDGNPARIMERTNAIDSQGYWVIDNWASLFGLTTYAYICDQFYTETGEESYKTEYDWAKAEYDSLLKSVEAVLSDTMEKYDFNYIPISMVLPNELTARKDLRDGNWAAHYLFGRWNWDGYLFGADQDSWLLDLTDQTYDYITEQKSQVFDSPYNMGGYGHGYYSSAYNAGYFSAALSGEKWRDGGIEAYLWMVNHSMASPYGWWEGIEYPNDNTVWNRNTSGGGDGSCQHMWGQSTITKVLIDSFFAEKADGTIIAGRGLPQEFNEDGEEIKISNYLCNGGKRIGFIMNTNNDTVTFELTGDELENTVSLELLALVDNIKSVSDGCSFDAAKGTVQIPAGVRKVTIALGKEAPKPSVFEDVQEDDWFCDDVAYVNEKGIMTGLKDTVFGPEAELSRAQFATILYRMAGSPEVTYSDQFPDVKDGEFYTSAVMWASEHKIVTGYAATGLYEPDRSISREELSVMLRRYAAYSGQDVTADSDLSFYPDSDSVSEFAKESMSWAVANHVIQGAGGQLLKPQDQANRAECAAIIHRYLEK